MNAPRATYRLQLHSGFTMRDAASVADYLAALGVSHIYCSPILQSVPKSPHGYDGVDPERIDEERGGEEGFAALREACAQSGLGVVLDIVPNHLDISSAANRWWHSVLEHGPASPHARVFDIDWDDAAPIGADGVLVPVLGDQLTRELSRGTVFLERDGGRIAVRYYDHAFPLSPRTCAGLFAQAAERQGDSEQKAALCALAHESAELPHAADEDPVAAGERIAGARRLEEHLATLTREHPDAARAIDAELERVSDSASELEDLLARQNYRLTVWRAATHELNYRRFFDINTLAGVRVEDEAVFDAVHALVLSLVREGAADGLRIDHPDGLRDPRGYFDRLSACAPEAWIVAEKILEHDEPLRDWAIAGTTGYDFLNDALGVLIDRRAEDALTALYEECTGERGTFGGAVFETKRNAAEHLLAADRARLVGLLERLAERHAGLGGDAERMGEAVSVLAACMPVYRSYVVPERGEIDGMDRRVIREAHDAAAERRPHLAPEPLSTIRDLLLLEARAQERGARPTDEDEFVARFQQYSAPVMAKGVEDTAFYRWNRFIALNEVGGAPDRFGIDAETFHERNRVRAQDWPASMLATSTHDTKRSEDVCARLAVLSEIPGVWAEEVREWMRMNDGHRRAGAVEIDRNTEYLLYQTLVGAWPIDAERASAFMHKAAKEAKQRTSWLDPDEAYESALDGFVRAVLGDDLFTAAMQSFVNRVRTPGRIKSLAQTLCKLTCPGVPDIYRGCELWDLSLVDPDNRRPVDYALRRDLLVHLNTLETKGIRATLEEPDDPGLTKLWVTKQALRARRKAPDAFAPGSGYEALGVHGDASGRALAYGRTDPNGAARCVVVVPTRTTPHEAWGDGYIRLPEPRTGGEWVDTLTGARVASGSARLSELLGAAPLALLMEEA